MTTTKAKVRRITTLLEIGKRIVSPLTTEYSLGGL
jgi:hypothetical protein